MVIVRCWSACVGCSTAVVRTGQFLLAMHGPDAAEDVHHHPSGEPSVPRFFVSRDGSVALLAHPS